jgi:thiol-disulfide isomerase/thioredoxin
VNNALKTFFIFSIGVVALGAGYFANRMGSGPRSVNIPSAAAVAFASMELATLSGQKSKIADWKGKVIVVNFWATWCSPCREEIPALVRTQQKLGVQGVQIVGIAIDQLERVKPFSEQIGINYPVLLAETEGLELARAAGNEVGALPFTVVIDRQGKIVKGELGGVTEEKLEKLVRPLL